MLGAGEASPRFGEWAAETSPDRALRRAGIGLVVAAAYLLIAARLGVSGRSQWLLATVAVALPVTIPVVRRVLVDTLPFLVLAAVYDWLGLARSFVVARGVHIAGPYLLDKTVFGTGSWGERLSLNELFARHHWAFVDLVTGSAYFSYVYAVIGFAIFLAVVDRTSAGAARTRALGWTFLGVNVASFLIYLACPVAPPWYVAAHGFGPVDAATAASPAALVRWDALIGVPYFANFYAQASDVFGAMPSMHCAYPMLLLLYARELRRPRLVAALAAFELLMCFSAVYLQHHYVTDVIAGVLCAVAGYRIERAISGRLSPQRASATWRPAGCP